MNRGFFQGLGKLTEWDLKMSKRLRSWVASKNWFVSSSSAKWGPQFRIIRLHYNKQTEEIEKLLDWYIKNYGKGITLPKIQNGEDFKKRFDWIQESYQKNQQIDDDEKDLKVIIKVLNGLNWPKGSLFQLSSAVKQCAVGYDNVMKKVTSERKHANRRIQFLKREMGSKKRFLIRWFTNIHKQVIEWVDWSGNLQSFVFQGLPSCQITRRYIASVLCKYERQPIAYEATNKIMEKL